VCGSDWVCTLAPWCPGHHTGNAQTQEGVNVHDTCDFASANISMMRGGITWIHMSSLPHAEETDIPLLHFPFIFENELYFF